MQDILQDQQKVQGLVQLSDIAVRAVDGFAGEKVSMRVCFSRHFIAVILVVNNSGFFVGSCLKDSLFFRVSVCACVKHCSLIWIGLNSQVDYEGENGKKAIGIFSHKMLSV